ncbi:MAG: hypothetical protein PHF86_13070 [Candidatus Nanoarchaeia archaeon]|nr:hypothetical protein [Candidatus Nanoarchaeia archaeon]
MKKPKVIILKRKKGPRAVRSWFSTGCTLLDLAISDKLDGGLPAGRITHIYGLQSTTKSVLALEPLGSAQRKGGKAYYDDVESALNETWLAINGVVLDHDPFTEKEPINGNFGLRNTETIEKLFDDTIPKILKEIEKRPELVDRSCYSVDSLTALPCKEELEKGLEAGTYGGDRPKKFGIGYRKRLREIAKKGLCIIVIDKLRSKFSKVSYGEQMTYSGGHAIGFYAYVQIHLKKGKIIENKNGKKIGIIINFIIAKNKAGQPYREGSFRFLFKYGIDDIASNIDFVKKNKDMSEEDKEIIKNEVEDRYAKALKAAEKSGRKASVSKVKKEISVEYNKKIKQEQAKGWYSFRGHKTKSLDEMVAYIEENNLEHDLRKEVFRIWKSMDEELVRKPKIRR